MSVTVQNVLAETKRPTVERCQLAIVTFWLLSAVTLAPAISRTAQLVNECGEKTYVKEVVLFYRPHVCNCRAANSHKRGCV